MKVNLRTCSLLLLTAAADVTCAIKVDIHDSASIKAATSRIVHGLMKYYTGNVTNTPETIAILGRPYYWWEAGAMWGALVDYNRLTGDASYNDVTYEALLSQVGPAYDYMVPMYNKEEGNDDQAFWGFATMTAAEHDWRAPSDPIPSWLQLTINLWNTQARRWDTTSCNGGLKWQIFAFNNGYDYKNTVSNGAFFQLSARLARFTGNSTYLEWAQKSWDWSRSINLIGDDYSVYDGTDDKRNCTEVNQLQWSYNTGILMYGAAVLYNYTNGSSVWEERTAGLLKASSPFFSPFDNATNVMWEQACEGVGTCNYDMFSFKAYLGRFMWATTKMAPFTANAVSKLLSTSAVVAAKSCSGGSTHEECGSKWYIGGSDGVFGPGQQLSALEVLQGLLTNESSAPMTLPDVKLRSPADISSALVVGSAHPPSAVRAVPSDDSKASRASSGGVVFIGASWLLAGLYLWI